MRGRCITKGNPISRIFTLIGIIALSSFTFQAKADNCHISPNASYNYPVCTAANGSVSMAPTGGTTAYHYRWTTGDTSANVKRLVAGTYTVTVTDAVGCTVSRTFVLTATGRSVLPSLTSFADTCNGGRGKITLTMNGNGNAPFRYNWSNGTSAANAIGLVANTYTLTVADSNGCSATVSATVGNVGSAIAANGQVTQPACPATGGSISISPTGGTSNTYQASWSNGVSGNNLSNLAAGNYKVTVTGTNGCSTVAIYTVNAAPAAIALNVTPILPVCNDGKGAILLNPTGGTGPYTENWSNGRTGTNVGNLLPGTYTVTITDQNNCTSALPATLPNTPAINAGATITNPVCTSSNGVILLNPTLGNAPYQFNWSTGDTVSTISNLSAGSYTVTITDAKGCSVTNTSTLSVFNRPLTFSSSTVVDTCASGHGAASVAVTSVASTSPFAYNWSNGSTNNNISSATTGNYSITITDNNGCTTTGTVNIGNTSTRINIIPTNTNPICTASNGSISIAVSGGKSRYNYSWSNGGASFTNRNLLPGQYTVTVTDAYGCTASKSSTLTAYMQPIAIAASATNDTCNMGRGTTSVRVTTNGNATPYSYNWSNGQNTATATGLTAHYYQITVTDGNGCYAVTGTSVSNIGSAISINGQPIQPICASSKGIINITPAGGLSSNYNVNWSNGATSNNINNLAPGNYTVTVSGSGNCSANQSFTINSIPAISVSKTITNVNCDSAKGGAIVLNSFNNANYPWAVSWGGPNGFTSTSVSINHLNPGSYNLLVTDAKGCLGFDTVNISKSGSIQLSHTIKNASCAQVSNGSINFQSVAPYSTPLSYQWSGPNGFTATTNSINNIAAGTYVVTVSENYGCTGVKAYTVANGPSVAIQYNVANVKCDSAKGGTITLSSISGATNPYTSQWSGPSGFSSTATSNTNLQQGNYNVTVTDVNGCSATATYQIQKTGSINLTQLITNTSCNNATNGSLNVTAVTPYSAPITYQWTGPNGFSANTSQIKNLTPGIYSVTVNSGVYGCSTTATDTVKQGSAIMPVINITNVNCDSSKGGSITLSPITGASYPWRVSWAGPNGYTGSGVNINYLSAGTYVMSLTDTQGCTASSNINVASTGSIYITSHTTIASCAKAFNGSIGVDTIKPYSSPQYSWSGPNGFTSSQRSINNLTTGVFQLTITEPYGCTSTHTDTINAGPPIALQYTTTGVKCDTPIGGAITLQSITNAYAPWTASWAGPNGFTSNSMGLTRLAGGDYTITVTDGHNCQATGTYHVDSTGAINATYYTHNTECMNSNDGSITYWLMAPYSRNAQYNWSGPNGYTAAAQSIGNLSPGTYTLTITEDFGCRYINNYTVNKGYDIGTKQLFYNLCPSPGNVMTVHPIMGDLLQSATNNCAAGLAGQITLQINGSAQYVNTLPGAVAPTSVNGNTLTWTIADFGAVNIDSAFFLHISIDSNAVIGSNICFNINITPTANDNNTGNNVTNTCVTVIHPYDPNSKSVSPEGDITPDQQTLTYTINFHNTGSAPAKDVAVLDTLDSRIDPSSIQLVASSHQGVVERKGNAVKFKFDNINLPDSVHNEAQSHGWLQYLVKLNSPNLGDEITNTAHILFDFNTPVITNTTLTKVSEATVNNAVNLGNGAADFNIYPNPAINYAYINMTSDAVGGNLELIDAIGKKCAGFKIKQQSAKLSLEGLAQGVYFVNLVYADGKVMTKKLIVNR